MSDSRFSSTPSAGGGDPYGFFAQPGGQPAGGGPVPGAVPGGTPAAAPFGTPPSPFGTPAASAPPFGSPAPYPYAATPQAAPPTRRRGRPVGLVVLAVLLVAGGWYGWRAWQHNQPVHVPATLAGLPQSSDPLIATTAAQIQKNVAADNPGIRLEVKAYSNGSDRVLFAGAARGRSDVSKDFAEVGSQVGPSQSVGSSTCATGTRVAVTLCERSEGDLTVLAMSVRRGGAADTVQQVAALVDAVWSQV